MAERSVQKPPETPLEPLEGVGVLGGLLIERAPVISCLPQHETLESPAAVNPYLVAPRRNVRGSRF